MIKLEFTEFELTCVLDALEIGNLEYIDRCCGELDDFSSSIKGVIKKMELAHKLAYNEV